MHPSFSKIKAVGFDLDKTLYRETPAMRNLVFTEITKRILSVKPDLKTIKNVIKLYGDPTLHAQLGAWSALLAFAGVDNSAEVSKECVASARVVTLIPPDKKLAKIIKNLSQKYHLFLITGSTKSYGTEKLQKIGINPAWFDFSLFADDKNFVSKTSPDSFRYFLTQSSYKPHEHVYIGDNLIADVKNPKSLGMRTILVGSSCVDADFSVTHIHQIGELLL